MSDTARKAAYRALARVEQDGAYSNLALNGFRELSALDASFATAIVMGVLENRRALDFLIGLYTKKTPDTELQILLRIGALQIFYLDRVPDSAACNETVTLCKELLGAKRAGFVNAVLRSLCREKEQSLQKLSAQPAAVRYSFGDGVATLLQEQYPEQYINIMEGFCRRIPLRLRVNTLKVTVTDIAKRLGATADGDMLTVREHQAEAVQGISRGEYFVQGYGSQMAVRMLDAKAGDTVIDVCACPGGKTLGAAIDMQNSGRIISADLHKNKLPLIEKSAKTLGISMVETYEHDARRIRDTWCGIADRVICDVPCSGLGVVASKPEIRYKDPAAFEGLYRTQKEILSASCMYLKDGGVLLYSTCTVNKKENEDIVRAFLTENKAFCLTEEHTWLPTECDGEGFYAAKLVKRYGT